MPELNKQTLKRMIVVLFLVAAGCIVLYWILHETERAQNFYDTITGMFSPFVLGAAVAFILNVPMRALEGLLKGVKNGKLRRVLAILLTFVAALLVLGGVFWLLIPQLIETIRSLIPALQAFIPQVEAKLQELLNDRPQLLEWVERYTDFMKFDWGQFAKELLAMLGNRISTILGGAFSAVGIFASGLVDAVIGVVFALYCLFQKETLARQGRKLLYAFLPERVSDHIIRIMRLSNSTFSNFLSGQCIEVCILGALFAVSMAIFRMPYIPLVSVLVAITAFIPVVGAFVGCAIGAFLMFVNDPLQAIGFIGMFLVLQQIENNLIYPRVVGTSIGLSGMWVLVAVAVGGDLMGVAGMFLMIPFASVLHTLLREFTQKVLATKNIDPEKLKDQPPELRSHLKENHQKRKAKRVQKRNERKKPAVDVQDDVDD